MDPKTIDDAVAAIPTTVTVGIPYVGKTVFLESDNGERRLIESGKNIIFINTTDIDIYRALGLPYIERDASGEIFEYFYATMSDHKTFPALGTHTQTRATFLEDGEDDPYNIFRIAGKEAKEQQGKLTGELFDQMIQAYKHDVLGGMSRNTLFRFMSCAMSYQMYDLCAEIRDAHYNLE